MSDLIKNSAHFSKRQRDCLFYLVKGMTARQIAEKLHISNRTVEFHLESIKNKMKCKRKSLLIAEAWKMDFIWEALLQERNQCGGLFYE